MFPAILAGQFGVPTILGFAVFGAGLCLAAGNRPKDADEPVLFKDKLIFKPSGSPGYAWHQGSWKNRKARSFNTIFSQPLKMAEELVETK